MRKNLIKTVLKLQQSVFSFKELMLILGMDKPELLKRQVNYYVEKGELYSPRRGFYAKGRDYNEYEFGTRVYAPSYISFETVLASEGVIFQRYKSVYLASYLSRSISADGREYRYRKLAEKILYNAAGVLSKGYYSMASKERAFLDMLYIDNTYHFDNLKGLNDKEIFYLASIYQSTKLEKILAKIFRRHGKNGA